MGREIRGPFKVSINNLEYDLYSRNGGSDPTLVRDEIEELIYPTELYDAISSKMATIAIEITRLERERSQLADILKKGKLNEETKWTCE